MCREAPSLYALAWEMSHGDGIQPGVEMEMFLIFFFFEEGDGKGLGLK